MAKPETTFHFTADGIKALRPAAKRFGTGMPAGAASASGHAERGEDVVLLGPPGG